MPQRLAEIAEVIGDRKAWALMGATHTRAAKQGHRVKMNRAHRAFLYVGEKGPAEWIVKAIGEEAAARLVHHFGGEVIEMPSGGRAAKALRCELVRVLTFRAGLPDFVIAAALGMRPDSVRSSANKDYDPARLGKMLMASGDD